MKPVVIYYSYSGNTKSIAEKFKESLDCDIFEIETVTPYTGDYNAVVDQGKEEVESAFMPEIKPLAVDLSKYDTVILGMPVWWYTYAPAVKTFLNSFDLSGKKLYPFATNGGWLGHTFKDLKKECKADVKDGLNIRFNGKNSRTNEKEIEAYINSIS